MPKVIVNGLEVNFAAPDNSKGTAVIFVHGAGANHRHWGFQVQHLSEGYNPVAVDLPGHGSSQGNAMDSIVAYREFLLEFVQVMGFSRFVLGGHSMGGSIALDFAFNCSEFLAGLILAGTGARMRVSPQILDTFAGGRIYEDLFSLAYGEHISQQLLQAVRKEWKEASPEVFFADFTACDRFDIIDKVGSINVPALVICGDRDRLAPVKYSRYLAEQMPNARLVIIENCWHMAMMEKPGEFNAAVDEFLINI